MIEEIEGCHTTEKSDWAFKHVGFFASASARIQAIINYFNDYKTLPKKIDSFLNFKIYKDDLNIDLCSLLFKTTDLKIDYIRHIDFNHSWTLYYYNKIAFDLVNPFVEKYFSVTDLVNKNIDDIIKKYEIDFDNTVYILYRGNDKVTETQIASYEEFADKANEIKSHNPDIRFMIQTDEIEFKDFFMSNFENSFFIEDIPMINKDPIKVIHLLLEDNKQKFAVDFLSSIICGSKCKYVITHSGNCGLWTILFRSNANNTYQYLNGYWIS